MVDSPHPSPAVATAFAHLSEGATLDISVLDPVLRPWLETTAKAAVADYTLAALVAQQVLVDLGSRVASDFPSAQALEQWLGVRTVQTVGMFTGYTAPDVMPIPVAAQAPPWQLSFLAMPAFIHLPKWSTLSWLVGATASTAAVTGLAAISMTVMSPGSLGAVPPQRSPASVPPPITSILALPTNSPSAPPSPKQAAPSPSRSQPTRSSAGSSTIAKAVVKGNSGSAGTSGAPTPTPPPTPPVTPPPTAPPTPPVTPPPTSPPSPSPHCDGRGQSGDHHHCANPGRSGHDHDHHDRDDYPAIPTGASPAPSASSEAVSVATSPTAD